jgi:AcrR family transcriptional regulator
MVKQERALRTRRSLIQAAAKCFDRHGYDRTSLAGVSAAAGVTKGALSFHFSSKGDLANAVEGEAYAITRDAIAAAAAPAGRPALQAVIDVTHILGRLLEHDAVARAGVRLSREREHSSPEPPDWRRAWEPTVRGLLCQARHDHSLRPGADVPTIETMVACLVLGTELVGRRRPGRTSPGNSEFITNVWRLILPEISPVETLSKLRAEDAVG